MSSSVLEINFEEPDYAIEEGSDTTRLPIILQFRKNQNPFTVRISSVTFGTAESLDLGFFINPRSDSNATAGLLNIIMNCHTMQYTTVFSWSQTFWPCETNTAEFVLHHYSHDSLNCTEAPHVKFCLYRLYIQWSLLCMTIAMVKELGGGGGGHMGPVPPQLFPCIKYCILHIFAYWCPPPQMNQFPIPTYVILYRGPMCYVLPHD